MPKDHKKGNRLGSLFAARYLLKTSSKNARHVRGRWHHARR